MDLILFYCVKHSDIILVFFAAFGIVVSGERFEIHPWIYISVSILALSALSLAMNMRDKSLIEVGKRIAMGNDSSAFDEGFKYGLQAARTLDRIRKQRQEKTESETGK